MVGTVDKNRLAIFELFDHSGHLCTPAGNASQRRFSAATAAWSFFQAGESSIVNFRVSFFASLQKGFVWLTGSSTQSTS